MLLEIAIKRVLKGRMMVVRQRQRIERLRALGCVTRSAEQTLHEFENSLTVFEAHERELKERSMFPKRQKSDLKADSPAS